MTSALQTALFLNPWTSKLRTIVTEVALTTGRAKHEWVSVLLTEKRGKTYFVHPLQTPHRCDRLHILFNIDSLLFGDPTFCWVVVDGPNCCEGGTNAAAAVYAGWKAGESFCCWGCWWMICGAAINGENPNCCWFPLTVLEAKHQGNLCI